MYHITKQIPLLLFSEAVVRLHGISYTKTQIQNWT